MCERAGQGQSDMLRTVEENVKARKDLLTTCATGAISFYGLDTASDDMPGAYVVLQTPTTITPFG